MKLFLSSLAISEEQEPEFTRLVGKKPQDIKLAFIENAADVYDDSSRDWVEDNRVAVKACGYQVEIVDLRDYRNNRKELQAKLSDNDVIWVNGGNTFYLRWILQDTGADKIIEELVSDGKVYGGGSTGAIVACPTLKYFEDVDDPILSPRVIIEGLRFTEKVVVPHVDNEKYGKAMDKIVQHLQKDGYETVGITDNQAVIFDSGKFRIVGSR